MRRIVGRRGRGGFGVSLSRVSGSVRLLEKGDTSAALKT
jgi:hypothetical protein